MDVGCIINNLTSIKYPVIHSLKPLQLLSGEGSYEPAARSSGGGPGWLAGWLGAWLAGWVPLSGHVQRIYWTDFV